MEKDFAKNKKSDLDRPEYFEEEKYLSLLKKILSEGEDRDNRTEVKTRAIFSHHMSFDISKTIPLLTTKRIWFAGIVHELLWFLSGKENIDYLLENKVNIWKPWSDEHRKIGRVYGVQWRRWENRKQQKIDQIANLIESLKNDPFSRRHLLVAWNPGELDEMNLAPCHVLAQFFVGKNKTLSCQFYQRSVDTFLGLPFNLISYTLLTKMLAQLCGLKTHRLYFVGGDLHLYHNQMKQTKIQILRKPYPFPTVSLNIDKKHIDDFEFADFQLHDYKHHPALDAKIAV